MQDIAYAMDLTTMSENLLGLVLPMLLHVGTKLPTLRTFVLCMSLLKHVNTPRVGENMVDIGTGSRHT